MANYEIVPGTIGNRIFGTTSTPSLKKHLRLGAKKMKFFVIIPSGATISETIVVKNGLRGRIWALNVSSNDITQITVTPTTSDTNTSYAIAEAIQTWTGLSVIFAVEIK